MSRLIDADVLMKQLNEEMLNVMNRADFEDLIDRQPIAYNPEKVVEQLEEASIDLFGKRYQRALALWETIEIGRKGGVK